MYLNGLSSSLPEDVQHAFIRTLPGLRHCEIMRPAYAVEYDYLNPMDLYPSLESKILSSLFVAGQTNGTSGYEEAACQGLVAGINAALKLRGADRRSGHKGHEGTLQNVHKPCRVPSLAAS